MAATLTLKSIPFPFCDPRALRPGPPWRPSPTFRFLRTFIHVGFMAAHNSFHPFDYVTPIACCLFFVAQVINYMFSSLHFLSTVVITVYMSILYNTYKRIYYLICLYYITHNVYHPPAGALALPGAGPGRPRLRPRPGLGPALAGPGPEPVPVVAPGLPVPGPAPASAGPRPGHGAAFFMLPNGGLKPLSLRATE